MIKYIFLAFLALFFTACGTQAYNYNAQNKDLVFSLKEDALYTIKLSNPNFSPTHDSCATYSYILNDESTAYGKLFIEDITLDSNCKWNGLDLSFFEENFKESLKLQSMKKIQTIAIKNYEFLTYKINDESYMNLIYVYGARNSTFIVDYEGKLYYELLGQFDKNYKSKFADSKRFSSSYKESLVRKNMFKSYFNLYSSDFD